MIAGIRNSPASVYPHQRGVQFGNPDPPWKMVEDKESRETIHSGHFMISNVPQDEDETEERSGAEENVMAPVPSTSANPNLPTNSVAMRVRSTSDPTRQIGNNRGNLSARSRKFIDSSLSKLFECMTLAYRQKLTSPKWNNFKGLKLRWTLKIRLNNIIWRTWHMQFVKQVRPVIAPFSVEVDPAQHTKAEAVVLEGKYWKRHLSMVAAEYRRWRVWYKDRAQGIIPKDTKLSGVNIDVGRLERQADPANSGNLIWYQQQIDEPMILDDLPFPPELADALFNRLGGQQMNYAREVGNADFIQPGLLNLQPSLEELMDTLEPLHDFFSSQGLTPSSCYGSQYSMYDLGTDLQIAQGNLATSSVYQQNQNQESSYWRDTTSLNQQMIMNQVNQQPMMDKFTAPSLIKDFGVQQYQVQTSAIDPAAYQSTSQTPNYITLQPPYQQQLSQQSYTERVNDLDARKDLRPQRSLSGPTFGGPPLIDPNILNSLAQLDRNGSVSSGNLLGPPNVPSVSVRSMLGSTSSAPVEPAPVVVPPFPQPPTRARRPRTTKTSGTPSPSPVATESNAIGGIRMQNQALQTEVSQLAQLLKGNGRNGSGKVSGAREAASTSGSSAQASTKKLAPKPSLSTVDSKPMISPSSSSASLMNMSSGMASQQSVQETAPEPRAGFVFNAESLHDSRMSSFSSTDTTAQKTTDAPKPRHSDNRRINHITAEQKRRGHIKSGFEVLHALVPSLAQNPSVKVSKAVVLHKGAEYIHQLKEERRQMSAEVDELKQQIEAINQAVIACQQQLPATGAPINNRARNDRMNDLLEEYIRNRTMQNWKFWLFSLVMRPLFETYSSNVSTRSVDELSQSVMSWLDQQCTLVQLRPLIKEAMRKLSTTTHVLSDPARLPEEARKAVQKSPVQTSGQPPSSSSHPSSSFS